MFSRVMLTIVMAVSLGLGERVITGEEIVNCRVSRIDSLFVRTSMPGGGIRVFDRRDVLVVQVESQSRLDSLAAIAPELKFVLDVPAPVDTTALTEKLLSGEPKRDPIDRGAVILRGAVGLSSATQTTTVSLTPAITYFVIRGFGLGVDLSVTSTTIGSTSTSVASFGPSALLAFGQKSGTTFFTVGAGFGLLSMGSLSGSQVQLSVGLLPILKRCVAMPIQATLVRTTVSSGSVQASATSFQLGVGFGAALF
jgi:hypothetical protein